MKYETYIFYTKNDDIYSINYNVDLWDIDNLLSIMKNGKVICQKQYNSGRIITPICNYIIISGPYGVYIEIYNFLTNEFHAVNARINTCTCFIYNNKMYRVDDDRFGQDGQLSYDQQIITDVNNGINVKIEPSSIIIRPYSLIGKITDIYKEQYYYETNYGTKIEYLIIRKYLVKKLHTEFFCVTHFDPNKCIFYVSYSDIEGKHNYQFRYLPNITTNTCLDFGTHNKIKSLILSSKVYDAVVPMLPIELIIYIMNILVVIETDMDIITDKYLDCYK